jgi:hypothetical protein
MLHESLNEIEKNKRLFYIIAQRASETTMTITEGGWEGEKVCVWLENSHWMSHRCRGMAVNFPIGLS